MSDPEEGSFEERLRAAQARQAAAAPKSASGSSDTPAAMGIGVRVGVELVSALAVGLAIGWGLDWWLGTRPWLLALFVLLYAAYGAVSPFLPGLLDSRGIGPEEIGLIFAAGKAAKLISAPLVGWFGDRYAMRGRVARRAATFNNHRRASFFASGNVDNIGIDARAGADSERSNKRFRFIPRARTFH